VKRESLACEGLKKWKQHYRANAYLGIAAYDPEQILGRLGRKGRKSVLGLNSLWTGRIG